MRLSPHKVDICCKTVRSLFILKEILKSFNPKYAVRTALSIWSVSETHTKKKLSKWVHWAHLLGSYEWGGIEFKCKSYKGGMAGM